MGDVEKDKCQYIFMNLLRNKHVEAQFYLREWDQTCRCDKYADLSDVRSSFERAVGSESMTRIREFSPTEVDELKAAQAVLHYSDWCDKRLYRSLNWKNKAYFQIVHHSTRVLDFIGIGTVMYGGAQAVAITAKKVKHRRDTLKAAKEALAKTEASAQKPSQ